MKGKPCLIKQYATETYRGVDVQLCKLLISASDGPQSCEFCIFYTFLNLALCTGEWSSSGPSHFIPWRKFLASRRLSGPPELVSTLIEVKDKVPAYTMKAYKGTRGNAPHSLLTSALDGFWVSLTSSCFTLGERVPITHYTVRWVSPGASLDMLEKK